MFIPRKKQSAPTLLITPPKPLMKCLQLLCKKKKKKKTPADMKRGTQNVKMKTKNQTNQKGTVTNEAE
jgi:hypothetical protein